jgi:hypothetical protein
MISSSAAPASIGSKAVTVTTCSTRAAASATFFTAKRETTCSSARTREPDFDPDFFDDVRFGDLLDGGDGDDVIYGSAAPT